LPIAKADLGTGRDTVERPRLRRDQRRLAFENQAQVFDRFLAMVENRQVRNDRGAVGAA